MAEPLNFKNTSNLETLTDGKVGWVSPSNIALVKYWGKKGIQIPKNPSVSFTLSKSKTTTLIEYSGKKNNSFSFELFLDGKLNEQFHPKIHTFLERIEPYVPFISSYHFKIHTSNSFPHSSGIASSASGMSALALCIMSMEKLLQPNICEAFFKQKASFLARLGSGSACRSIEGELVVWGKHEAITDSSNLYGIKYPHLVHNLFNSYQDTILLVDIGKKQVSSTLGHNLMQNHPYAKQRFKSAYNALTDMVSVFKSGDLDAFIEIVEHEALSLHAMMMTSNPYFILMKPNTLAIINRIWAFRKDTQIPVCFTLDAGANVHVLYPKQYTTAVLAFIKSELIAFTKQGQMITDQSGYGAQPIKK